MTLGMLLLGALMGLPAAASAQDATAPTAEEIDDETTSSKIPLDFEWVAFPDSAKFKVLGLAWFEENQPRLWRMPQGRFDELPKGVKKQARLPSGGRLFIKCNSSKLGLKVKAAAKGNAKGFDVYVNGRFVRSAAVEEPDVDVELVLFKELDKREKEIVVYLPYHQEVLIKSVGVDKGESFGTPEQKFARKLPVVFYGSSVCQGSGAAKPGMTYEAILCRELNLDFVNLGFGGAGKAEEVVVDLVNSLPACCYVFDLGKSYGMKDKTAYKEMLVAVRKSHPDIPILCLTPITSSREVHSESYAARSTHTRTVMREAVTELIRAGEKKLSLMEGPELLGFDEHDGLSKDGVHPSDHGYSVIAGKLVPEIRKLIGLESKAGGGK